MLPVWVAVGPSTGSGADWFSLDKGHLPLVSEDALRSEDHEQHQGDADEDVRELLGLLRDQFNLRMQKATGQLGQSHLLSQVKRDIARVKTVLNQQAGK